MLHADSRNESGAREATGNPAPFGVFDVPLGTRYSIPNIPYRLPWMWHPMSAGASDRGRRWSTPYVLNMCGGDSAHARRLLAERVTDWICLAYSQALPDRIDPMMRYHLSQVTLDDRFTVTNMRDDLTGALAAADALMSVLDGYEPPLSTSVERMFYECYVELHSGMSAGLAERHTTALRDILGSAIDEAANRAANRIDDFQDFLPKRRVNLYGWEICLGVEYACDVDMTEELRDIPELRGILETAVDHVLFTNDLLSFAKEAKLGETMNSIWSLRAGGMTLQEAVDAVAARLIAAEESFADQWLSILGGPLGRSEKISRYLTGLAYLVAGSRRYHETSTRYHGPGHDGTPINNGIVTVQDPTNLFTPLDTEAGSPGDLTAGEFR